MGHYRAAILIRLNSQTGCFEFLTQDEYFPQGARHMTKFPGGMESLDDNTPVDNLDRELTSELITKNSDFDFRSVVSTSLNYEGNPIYSVYDPINEIQKDYYVIIENGDVSFQDIPLRKNERVDGNTVLGEIRWEKITRFFPDNLPKDHLDTYSALIRFFTENRIAFKS